MRVILKNVHRVRRKLTNGTYRYHYYLRGQGVRFWTCDGKPVDPANKAFQRAHIDAIRALKQGDRRLFDAAITEWLEHFDNLPVRQQKSEATMTQYYRYATIVRLKWGRTKTYLFDDKRMRRKIIKWHESMFNTPRKADMAVLVLSMILSRLKDRGILLHNFAENIKKAYVKPEFEIWSDVKLEAFFSDAPRVLRWHTKFKLLTGIRREDIVAIPVSADKGDSIDWKTSKTGAHIVVPVLPELRALLDEIAAYKREYGVLCTTILINSRNRPWTPDGLSASMRKHRLKHDITIREHRLRGNYCTVLMAAGFTNDEIALNLGWTEQNVRQMRSIYGDRAAALRSQIRRLSAVKL